MSIPVVADGTMLRATGGASRVSLDFVAPSQDLLLVMPHPDDEALGCGMALAAAVESGRRVAVLLLTDGENSHPKSAAFDTETRRNLRLCELRTALEILAPGNEIPLVRAGFPDGRSVTESAEKALDGWLSKRCVARARTIWSTWGHDPHCDHQVAAHAARCLAQRLGADLWSVPVWGRFGDLPVPDELYLFADDRFAARKRDAIAAHASQMTDLIADDPDGFVMPPALAEHFASHPEIFIRERPDA
ncbi:PIG-L deacetylase family protein [Qipengyuania sp. JC766]|uniref:PIG-L deacetylase family protein n=1 Tax=Qipengyuania sp. JC766 TaxID=3232139 RepID=UPI0034589F6A